MTTIKVYQLDDCDWWAGESLAACIAAGRELHGAGSYCDAEAEGRELTEAEMQALKVHREEDHTAKPVTFAEHLADLVASKFERFPQLFASTEI